MRLNKTQLKKKIETNPDIQYYDLSLSKINTIAPDPACLKEARKQPDPIEFFKVSSTKY